MLKNTGYIKLYRQMTEWEWYRDMAVKTLFIHCLLCAEWQEVKVKGKAIRRGTFETSREQLAKESGLSFAQVRRALRVLKESGEICTTKSPTGMLVTVRKYAEFQAERQNHSPTDSPTHSPTLGNSSYIEVKNNKKYKNTDFRPAQLVIHQGRQYSDEFFENLYKDKKRSAK